MQEKIQKIQDYYGRLLHILPELDKTSALWGEAEKIVMELESFYQNPEWLKLYDNANAFNIDTKGNYSILSQDAIWNVLNEYQDCLKRITLK